MADENKTSLLPTPLYEIVVLGNIIVTGKVKRFCTSLLTFLALTRI